ncbi:MAG: imidazole glycerol phosphate synthase subunit HisF [Butyrivibrio sp.]|uniref:AglZ/HisF2 family acetamidino modification protein n=1 Tax=Butyrivibrio sp. TaxID=28121 RepID=UPI0025C51A4B|nr:AglZ/HisF2 family acetamidino modification protein [Butyrivibrio sp.]MBQ6587202.1 imidazole glycerol phosphate synthase subunit HisF [Butyrivibrio sp.]
MNRPRVIPTLLIQDGNLVKTKKFDKAQYLGDPINAIKIFNEKYVDELCILDITATKENKEPDFELLEKMASEAFMPLSYGGGINNIDQIKRLFRLGFEKVVINTAASNYNLIRQAAEYFGSQSIVCSIDYRKGLFGVSCYVEDGGKKLKQNPVDMAVKYADYGAGEILLYSIDNDGMRIGYDQKTISAVSSAVQIPVIACGGARTVADLKYALDAGADAVAAGSLFVFFGDKQAVLINYPEEKELIENGIYSK